MANKKYISFDLTDDNDAKIVAELKRLDAIGVEMTPKGMIEQQIIEIKKTDDYKNKVKELLEEVEEE